MFEFRRLFRPAFKRPRDGLAGDDIALLELLDLKLLRTEARAANVSAGRVSTTDREAARLRQAFVWCELARRTGDAVALRKAASSAELVAKQLAASRPARSAAARLEQARCAILGAELFGEDGLHAAADRVLAEIASPQGLPGAVAMGLRARISAKQALARDAGLDALAALTGYDSVTNALSAANTKPARAALSQARADRAELTARCGVLLNLDNLVARAAADLAQEIARIDPAYLPLSWSRAVIVRAEVLTQLGRMNQDAGVLSEAVEGLSRMFDTLLKDHSPLDWARAQHVHGCALWTLAEVSGVDDAWPKASGAFDRAWSVVRRETALKMRAVTAERRGALAVQIALSREDPMELDAAEAAFRCDLVAVDPGRDPVGWALAQINLGRVYLARAEMGDAPRTNRMRAGVALAEGRELLEDRGLTDVAEIARKTLKV
jgi:hypothetical protein